MWHSGSKWLVGAVALFPFAQLFTTFAMGRSVELKERLDVWCRCVILGGFTQGQMRKCVGGILWKLIASRLG
jgi:hypothetical protein